MKTNGSMIATLGRTGSGVLQATLGRIWAGYTPTVKNIAGAGPAILRTMAGAPIMRTMAGTPTIRKLS